MDYATLAQLANYLGVEEGDLPDDADRLIKRASELIDHATILNIDEDDDDHLASAKNAVCAQVEKWIEVGEQDAITGQVTKSVSLGRFSVNNEGLGSGDVLAPRARRHLLLAGLLYRGVLSR